MSVEEALALSIKGATTICLNTFICPFHRCFKLFVNFYLVSADDYLYEEPGEEGQFCRGLY